MNQWARKQANRAEGAHKIDQERGIHDVGRLPRHVRLSVRYATEKQIREKLADVQGNISPEALRTYIAQNPQHKEIVEAMAKNIGTNYKKMKVDIAQGDVQGLNNARTWLRNQIISETADLNGIVTTRSVPWFLAWKHRKQIPGDWQDLR